MPSPQYPGQFITLCFDQLWPFSDPRQAINTQAVIYFLFIHPPVFLCCRSYSQTRLPSIKACLFYKGTLVALESSPSPCSLRFIAPGLTALGLSLSLGCQSRQRDCSSIALQSVSSPCSQYDHLAVSLLALLLAALKSVSQPCSRHLTVSIVTLQSVSSPCSC